MSAKINLGTTLGSMVLLVIIGVVVITGSQANEQAAKQAQKDSEAASAQSEQNNRDIQYINATLTDFIKDRNAAFNKTFEFQKEILARQLSNEQNIITNLTAHRIISNLSNSNQTAILNHVLNQTAALTSDEYNKAAEKKVLNIIGNMTEEHKLIFKALNITKAETNGENKQLDQLVREFLKAQKDNNNTK